MIMEHVDYPHWPGTLYDCPACEVEMTEAEDVEYDTREYHIDRNRESGLQEVFRDGVKIGQSQTPAAARLILRNDRRTR